MVMHNEDPLPLPFYSSAPHNGKLKCHGQSPQATRTADSASTAAVSAESRAAARAR